MLSEVNFQAMYEAQQAEAAKALAAGATNGSGGAPSIEG
jgi:preprotein translocase subunit SecB